MAENSSKVNMDESGRNVEKGEWRTCGKCGSVAHMQ